MFGGTRGVGGPGPTILQGGPRYKSPSVLLTFRVSLLSLSSSQYFPGCLTLPTMQVYDIFISASCRYIVHPSLRLSLLT